VTLAVERATETQIARMRKLAEYMLVTCRDGSLTAAQLEERINASEVEFHQTVFDAAGGQLAGEFHRVLVEYFKDVYGHGPHNAPQNFLGLKQHLELVNAFVARDAARAVVTLTEHLRPIVSSDESPGESE